jgi:predicted metal-dependent hydrolase
MHDPRLTRGVELFNAGCFFECHDVLEDLWMETRNNDRLFLQGLIQVAVGYYHFFNRNFKGSRSQFSKGVDKLERYRPSHMGIELDRFIEQVRRWMLFADQGIAGEPPQSDGTTIPNLVFSNSFPTKENSTWQQ